MTNTQSDSNHVDQAPSIQPKQGTHTKESRFSPTWKGALIGAVAGSVLPVFGTVSGAIIGGISGKIYEKKKLKAAQY